MASSDRGAGEQPSRNSEVPDDPAARARLLQDIPASAAADHHELLRAFLAAETRARANPVDDEHDFYENLYWCAFLLFCVGDPSDVPALWRAKQIDFDTSIGLDVETLFGAGIAPTLAWLRSHGHIDLAEELGTHDLTDHDLARWRVYREGYFYS